MQRIAIEVSIETEIKLKLKFAYINILKTSCYKLLKIKQIKNIMFVYLLYSKDSNCHKIYLAHI